MYGAVMGLAGLGLSARASATVLPGVFRAPAYFTELWVGLGALAFLILVPLYAAKIVLYPSEVRSEFMNPAQLGFCGALPVGMGLVAGGVGAYVPALGSALWWAAAALLLSFQVWALYRWLSGGLELGQLNAGWLIILVGGIVLPGPGIALGHAEPARFLFGISTVASGPLTALLLYRAMFGPQLPEVLRPTWFILLVPPSLIYANGLAFYRETYFLENLFFFGLVLAAALLVYARRFLAWPFGAPWWAFTFPLDALAYAAARYAQEHPSGISRGVSAVTIALATAFVCIVLVRQIAALRK